MSERWTPSVTVAAIVEKDGRYLLIEERTQEGLRLNNPAGHLDPGESLIEACARECLEETAHPFQPKTLVGIYQSRFHRAAKNGKPAEEITMSGLHFQATFQVALRGKPWTTALFGFCG